MSAMRLDGGRHAASARPAGSSRAGATRLDRGRRGASARPAWIVRRQRAGSIPREHARGDGGFTLLELLVVMLLGTLVLGAGLSLFQMHGRVARGVQASVSAIGAASFAVDVVARDLQLAGANPSGVELAAIAAASADGIVLQSDLDGDGMVDPDSAERLTLAWSGSSGGRLLRWLGSQPMSIAATVPSGDFALSYFDAAGTEIVAAAGESLDAAARARVQRVVVRLAVEERFGAERRRAWLETAAAMRNRAMVGGS